jgi:hypothetical protein
MTSINLEHSPFTGHADPRSSADPIPRSSIARRLVFTALGGMTRGRLLLELPEGEVVAFGEAQSPVNSLPLDIPNVAKIRVRTEAFFRRVVLASDIGFAESYMAREWETDDVTAVIAWFVLNIDTAPTLSGSSVRGSWSSLRPSRESRTAPASPQLGDNRAAEHRRALRPVQRLLRALSRSVDDVFLGIVEHCHDAP